MPWNFVSFASSHVLWSDLMSWIFSKLALVHTIGLANCHLYVVRSLITRLKFLIYFFQSLVYLKFPNKTM